MPCCMPKKDWRYSPSGCANELDVGRGLKNGERKDATWWFLFFDFISLLILLE